MPWYDSSRWFKGEQKPVGEIVLCCDNPQCKLGSVQAEPIAYDKQFREIYHLGECAIEAGAHRAFKTGEAVIGNIDYIGLEEAQSLFRKGKLSQASKLEDKTAG